MNHKKLLLLFFAFSLAQCAQSKSDSSDVKLEFTPDNPVVIKAPITLNPGTNDELEVEAPWFKYSFKVQNGSDKIVTIQSLTFKVTGFTTSGGLVSADFTLDPGDYDLTFLLEVPANDSEVFPATIYLGGLPADVSNAIYTVEVEVQGWFGQPEDPISRLEKKVYFITK